MNKDINSLYLNTQKLLRENQQKFNTIVKNKTRNIVVENTGLNMSEEIFFEGNQDSILHLNFGAKCDTSCNMKVFLNNIQVVDVNFLNDFYVCKNVYIDKFNILKIELFPESFSEIKLNINLNGEFDLEKNSLINLKNIGDNLYFVKGGYLSLNNELLSCTTYINNKSYYNSVKYYDYNVNYNNLTNDKSLLVGVYKNTSNQVVLDKQSGEANLNIDNIESACLLSSNNINYYYNLVYIMNGRLFFRSYNSDMIIATSNQLSTLNNIYFKEVKSISSDIPTSYFWAKNQDGFWYLINVSFESGDVVGYREFVECDDISSYYYGNTHSVIQLLDNGIKLERYDNINLKSKILSENYMNVDNAFIYDNHLYLVSGSVVQEVEL